MNMQWQPPQQPLPPQAFGRRRILKGRSWLSAAIIGSAIVIAAGLVSGALILRGRGGEAADSGMTTCQAWTQTRQTLRSIPALPQDWNWDTPNIDNLVTMQNAPVGQALDLFESAITAEPADIAQAAQSYVAARRKQMQSLADRTYTAADGAAVDGALERLNTLCGVKATGQPV